MAVSVREANGQGLGKGAQLMATHSRAARIFGPALAVGALALTGMVATAPARADTVAFLNDLQNAGITTPRGEPELKEWGWEVCALFDQGVAPDKVKDQAVYNSGSSPQYGMTVEQADDFVRFAETDLCSDHK
jgi:hypothetical protein